MGETILPVLLFIVLAVVLLVVGWFLAARARRSNEMGTFQGFGTRLYGNTPTPNGHIATQWVVLFFIPVFPVRSYEIYSQQASRVSPVEYRTEYGLKELPSLYWPQVRTVAIIGVLIWSFFLCVLSAGLVQYQRTRNAAQPVSGAAPDFTLPLLSGYDGGLGKTQIKLSDLRGQVVFISFCYSMAQPCSYAEPVLERVWKQYRSKGVLFIGMWHLDTEAAAVQFLKRFDVTFANGPDAGGKIASRYHITGVPEYVLLNGQGKVIWTKRAPITESELVTQLDKALAK